MAGDGYVNPGRPSLLCSLLAIFLTLTPTCFTNLPAQPPAPSFFLWAWERPEDLSFIDPHRTGVAYLAGTVWLRGPDVVIRPRLQPLKLPESTHVIAVVRVETRKAALTTDQCSRCAREIIRFLPLDGLRALQIDFDASVSERPFYAALLSDLRSRLPQSLGLSITALASWCTWDDWLSDLSIQEAVPMLFRMGRDRDQVIGYLQKNGGFGVKKCRGNAGISTDEPIRYLPPCKALYIFNPRPWSSVELDRMTDEVRQWRESN